MRNFNIDFNELSDNKQEELEQMVREDLEMDLIAMKKKVDNLTLWKMVDDVIRLTFNSTATLEIDTEYLIEKYSEEVSD